MRICVLNPGVVHAVPRTLAFAKHFDEVHYIDISGRDDPDILKKNGISYHAPFADGKYALGSLRLQKLFHKISPDGIVCHFASGTHYFNSIFYGKCPVAVIAMGHDVLYDEGDKFVPYTTRMLIKMALRRTAYISAKSGIIERRVRLYGVKAPVDVNYWGVDLKAFSPRTKEACRERLGLNRDVPIVLSPRAMEPRLNIHVIVDAMEQLRDMIPDVNLIILGRENSDYRRRIEGLIRQKGLSSNVLFYGEVGQGQLIDFYNAADVVVSVGKSEGFPNSVLEALACQRPVVVGKIPHIEELLKDDSCVLVCEIDATVLALTLVRTLQGEPRDMPDRLQRAYSLVKEVGNTEVNGKKFADSFKAVIKSEYGQQSQFFGNGIFFFVYCLDMFFRRFLRTREDINVC